MSTQPTLPPRKSREEAKIELILALRPFEQAVRVAELAYNVSVSVLDHQPRDAIPDEIREAAQDSHLLFQLCLRLIDERGKLLIERSKEFIFSKD
jgi:hypothetical protein